MIEVEFTGEFQYRNYLLKELAAYYQVDKRTLKKWLATFKDELGHRQGNYYNSKQVKIIISKLGVNGTARMVNKR